jgi:pimeloyl-ACP methyl ester carboxylesterase
MAVPGGSLHLVQTGNHDLPPVLFLHGWPQHWSVWTRVMELAGPYINAIAIDLPGVGGSVLGDAPGTTHGIADLLSQAVQSTIGPRRLTVIGHDVGGQVVYAWLMRHPGTLDGAVIMDVVVPGVPPWEEVLRNPHIWHFAFHAIPQLPERLVTGHELEYFDFFYQALARHPERIDPPARAAHAAAYARLEALRSGFNWYRSFADDAVHNETAVKRGVQIAMPVLYVRGSHESGNIDRYLAGLRHAGLPAVRGALIPDCGHFAPEEQPAAVWSAILAYLRELGVVRN